MKIRVKSVNALISIAISILLLIGIVGMVAFVSASFYSNTFDIETRNMREAGRAVLVETDEYIDSCLSIARSLAIQKQVRGMLGGEAGLDAAVTDQLASIVKSRGDLNSVFIVDKQGKAMAGQTFQGGSMAGMDLSGRHYWPDIMQGKESLGRQISKGASTGILVFTVVVPVKDGEGRVIGAAGLAVNWSKFVDKYIAPVKVGNAGYVYILDDQANIIAHPDQSSILQSVAGLQFVKDSLAQQNGLMRYEYKGVEKVQAFNLLQRTGWLVCVNDTEEELAAPAIRQRNILIAGGAASYVVLLGLILYMVRRFVLRPIESVQAYSAQIAKGNYAARLDGTFNFELAALADNIVHMTSELKDKLSFSQSVLEGIATPFFIGDKDCKLVYTNKPMLDLMDRSGSIASYLGKTVSDFVYGEPYKDSITASTLRENRVYNGVEADLAIHSGKVMHVRIDSAPLYDLDKNLSGAITTVLDVTHLKEQQERIAKQNERITEAATTTEAISSAMSQATEQLSSQVEQCSRGAQLQSQRVSETATAMEEMNATVLEVARNAAQAADIADRAKRKAQDGASVVTQVVQGIAQVQQQSLALKEDMGELGSQAQGIGQIMNVISDIADQTNLLALNAAIEAARAGEAGRGFAVVADEVRKLAEKTMTATKEVGQAISSIQQGTRKNIENVERAVATIDNSTRLANASGEALAEIVALVDATTDQVRSIATASEQQSAATEEINHSVEEVNRISNETSEAMDHAATAVRELAGQARTLEGMIESMKSGEDNTGAKPALTQKMRALGR